MTIRKAAKWSNKCNNCNLNHEKIGAAIQMPVIPEYANTLNIHFCSIKEERYAYLLWNKNLKNQRIKCLLLILAKPELPNQSVF